jgi:hypothetical protein
MLCDLLFWYWAQGENKRFSRVHYATNIFWRWCLCFSIPSLVQHAHLCFLPLMYYTHLQLTAGLSGSNPIVSQECLKLILTVKSSIDFYPQGWPDWWSLNTTTSSPWVFKPLVSVWSTMGPSTIRIVFLQHWVLKILFYRDHLKHPKVMLLISWILIYSLRSL